jgi:hypothetical protein
MDSEPLIWTSKGNLPIASLQYAHAWEDTPEYLKFSETYTLDGEIVKQSAHVYVKQGMAAQPEQGAF